MTGGQARQTEVTALVKSSEGRGGGGGWCYGGGEICEFVMCQSRRQCLCLVADTEAADVSGFN